MITLTPTKQFGSTAKAHPVVYTEPGQTVTDEMLAEMVQVDGMNAAFVADLLSAYLTHERCGTHLYKSVAGRTNNPVLKSKYEEFGEETQRHVTILEQLIVSTGGNPTYVSPMARAVEAADSHALMSTYLGSGGLDPMAAELAMLDVVFMAAASQADTTKQAKKAAKAGKASKKQAPSAKAAQKAAAKRSAAKAPATGGGSKAAKKATVSKNAATAKKAPAKKAPAKKASKRR